MTGNELQTKLVGTLEKCGFDKSRIMFDYKIWIGNAMPCILDVALVANDGITLLAAFEVKCKIEGISGLKCAQQVYRICKGGIPCYIVDGSSGQGKIAEVATSVVSPFELDWVSLGDDIKLKVLFQHLRLAQKRLDHPIEKVEDYLRAVDRAILNMRHLHGGEIDNQCVKFMFRGHSNVKYELCPSPFRNLEKDGECPKDIVKESYWPEEQYLLDEAERIFPDLFRQCMKDVERLAVAQHYEIPTRLLDVSGNALVALYFAAQPNTTGGEENDGKVFVFKVSVAEYRKELQIGKIDLSVSKQHRAKGRRGKLPFDNTPQLAFPSFLTPRQKAQDGAFYMMGDDGKSRVDFAKADYDEIIIPKGCKEAIRGELEQRCNVHGGTLFPESLTSYKDKLLREAAVRIRNSQKG